MSVVRVNKYDGRHGNHLGLDDSLELVGEKEYSYFQKVKISKPWQTCPILIVVRMWAWAKYMIGTCQCHGCFLLPILHKWVMFQSHCFFYAGGSSTFSLTSGIISFVDMEAQNKSWIENKALVFINDGALLCFVGHVVCAF